MDEENPECGSLSSSREGLVVRLDSRACLVDVGQETIRCAFRGKLFERSSSKPVVVGDRVTVTPTSKGEGVLEKVHERKTKLSRRRASDREDVEQVVVANVDLLVIVGSVHDPPLKTRLVDRFLVAASRGGFDAVLCLNKSDLLGKDDPEARAIRETYADLHLPIVETSATLEHGIEELEGILRGRIAVLAGPSGVGKSSLLNRLCPELAISTKDVGRRTRKGRHTTTAVSLYAIPGIGHVVDTPGIRGFGLWDVDEADLSGFFPDLFELAGGCRFRGCSHTHEPACAVKIAVEEGRLREGRYRSYVRILDSLKEDQGRGR